MPQYDVSQIQKHEDQETTTNTDFFNYKDTCFVDGVRKDVLQYTVF